MCRVLYVTDSLNNGGAERQFALLINSLPNELERRIWCWDGGPFVDVIKQHGFDIDINERAWRWDFTPVIELWKRARAWRPNIIHSYGFMSALAVMPIAKALHIPWVDGTIRQANMPNFRGHILKWCLKWADRIIANSQAGLLAFGVGPERGRVVYNGFDPDRFSISEYYREGKTNLFSVIMVGRMHPMKDFETYLDAARVLIYKGVNCKFIALGEGMLRDSLKKEAKDLIEKGYLIFPEPTLEVMRYVAGADVGVLMTSQQFHKEGISNALMEYMAGGLPVVCSESGGNRELVIDGLTGFIIDPGDSRALAERLYWLWKHPDIAHGMGLAGKKRIQSEFTVKNLVTRTLAVYQEVLGC